MPQGPFGGPRPAAKNTLGLHFYYDANVLSLRSVTSQIKTNIEQKLDLDRGNAFQVDRVGVGISSPTSTFNVFLKLKSDFGSRELTFDEIREIENNVRELVEQTTNVELITITVSPT